MNSDPQYENPYAPSAVSNDPSPIIPVDASFKPFQTIWFNPRRTIAQIVEYQSDYKVILLASLLGSAELAIRMPRIYSIFSAPISLTGSLAIILLLGPIAGILAVFLYAWLLKISGSALGGVAWAAELRAAFVWGSLPVLAGAALLVLFVPVRAILANYASVSVNQVSAIAFSLIQTIFSIWRIILLCHTVAEVQRFRSAALGFGNLILAGLMLLLPFWVLLMLLSI